MNYNIPITLFRDLPVYSGTLPPDGVQLIVVEGNTGLCRAGLASLLSSTATVAEGVPSNPGDTLAGNLAWEDGALYVNTEAGWEKTALYADNWGDIGHGTRFMRVDAAMTLTATEIDNVITSLDISEATSANKGLVYIASSIDEGSKVATAGLVKDYVDTFGDRIEEVYTYVQEAVEDIDNTKAEVEDALAEIRDIGSGISEAKSYVDDVRDAVDDLATAASGDASRAELAAERAEQAAGAIPGFDEYPVAGSRNAVRSGGIKSWGDTSFAPLSHVEDVGTGYSEPHVSDEDRERWDAASGGSVPERYVEFLKSLADNGELTVQDVKIGPATDNTIIWARDIGVDNKTALTLTADSMALVSGGLDISGDTSVTGDVVVSGSLTAGGHAVVTVNDEGAFPTGGSLVDGYATVGDAVGYIALVETSIKDYVAQNYTRVPAGGGYAELAGNNTMTGVNTFTGGVILDCPVSVVGNALVCNEGISLDGGDLDVGTGGSVNAPDANIGTITADVVTIGTGGSLRVDGDTNVAGLYADGDLQVGGMATVAGTMYADGDLHVEGVTTFGDRIDSDVIIGHGSIGKVQARADLHIGDPSAAGTMRYNGYTYSVDAGPAMQATGQVELVNPMVPCLITIGDNDPLYIEPERALLSQPDRPALMAAPALYGAVADAAGTNPYALINLADYTAYGLYMRITFGSGGYGNTLFAQLGLPGSELATRIKLFNTHIRGAFGFSFNDDNADVPFKSSAVDGKMKIEYLYPGSCAKGNIYIELLDSVGDSANSLGSCILGVPGTEDGMVESTVDGTGEVSGVPASGMGMVAIESGKPISSQSLGSASKYVSLYITDPTGRTASVDMPSYAPDRTVNKMIELLSGLTAVGGDKFTYDVLADKDSYTASAAYPLSIKAKENGPQYNGYKFGFRYNGGASQFDDYEIVTLGGRLAGDPGTDTDTGSTSTSTSTSTSISTSTSTSSSDPPVVHPLTPQQIADLISTLPDYTAVVHGPDSSLVDITAKLPGARFNADTEAVGGVEVIKPVSDGSDKRDAGGLAELIRNWDYFDMYANTLYAGVIEVIARQAGSYVNGRPIECTGCFGEGTVLMGSKVEGADGVDATTYNLVLNGEHILPGGGGGGEPFDGHLENDLYVGHEGTAFKIYLNGEEFKGGVELDDMPVEGSSATAVSSGGVYRATYVKDNTIPPTVVSKATTGSGEVNAYNTDKYAKIGLYHVSGLAGRLVKVKMKNRSDGNIYNVHLQVSYDESFQDSTTRLSYDKIGATGDHHLEWLEWNFDDPLELTGDKPLYVRWRKPDVTAENVYTYSRKYGTIAEEDDSFTTHDGVFERNVPLCELFVETEPGRVEKAWAGPELAAHEGDYNVHLDSSERAIINNLMAGWLWYPGSTGSVTVTGDTSGAPNGVSIQSTNAYGRVEVQDYGVVITATRRPQWLEASSESYAFHDILTTKDLDPASVPAVEARVSALENTTVPAVANRVTELEEEVPHKQDLYKEASTAGGGSDNYDIMVLSPAKLKKGKIRFMSFKFDNQPVGTALYLGVFQRAAGSTEGDPRNWQRIGVSSNSVRGTAASIGVWKFDGVSIDGDLPVAFITMTSSSGTAGGTQIRTKTADAGGDSNCYVRWTGDGWTANNKTAEHILEIEPDYFRLLDVKQDRLTAGHGIAIDGNNVISAAVPTPESTIPAVLRHGHVYTVAVSSGTVDLSAKTVEQGATAELYIDYTGGTLKLPSWWWLDGMSSSEGDHDIPPWGQDMEANHRYVVVVRNDGRKTVANVQYEYPL